MRPTPLQIVKDKFGGRDKLISQLCDSVDQRNGDSSADEVRSRLNGLSNTKLLRLYRIEQQVRERFGDREKLIAHIVDARKEAGLSADDNYRRKLDDLSKGQLLDMTRIKHPARPVKLTPEQRLKKKRGKKQRARALAKING